VETVTIGSGLYHTQIVVNVDGLRHTAAGDIIGVNGTTDPCFIARIDEAKNGTIFAGTIRCLVVPTGGDEDIDLYTADEGTGKEDDAITGLTETQLLDHGDWAADEEDTLTALPTDTQYLYLVGQTGSPDADYTTGMFVIDLWGN